MASAFTSIYNFEKQGTGENANTWGTKLNTVIDGIEKAIGGSSAIAVSIGTNTISASDARAKVLRCTGAIASDATLELPTAGSLWVIVNGCSGAGALKAKISGASNEVTIEQGEALTVVSDGTELRASPLVPTISSFGETLIDDADASAARTTLGLGSLATASTITASQISDATADAQTIITTATAAGAALMDDANAAAQRTTLDVYSTSQVDTAVAGVGTLFRNKLMNPLYLIDAEGNTPTVFVSGDHVVDGWALQCNPSQPDLSRVTGNSVPYALEIDSDLAKTPAAGEYGIIQTAIEGYNCADLLWGTANAKSITVAGSIYATVAGTYCAAIRNSAVNRAYVVEITVSSAATWENFEFTVPGDTSGTWDTTSGVGLRLSFALDAGTTFHTTAGAWAAGNFLGTSNQANGFSATTNVLRIENVRLAEGSSAIDTEWRPIDVEAAHCQRYYQKDSSSVLACITNVTNTYPSWLFPVTMRTSPTLSVSIGSGSGATFAASVFGFRQIGNNSVDSVFSYRANARLL